MNTHTFDSTSEAYAATQTDESIEDGDVLLVPSEHVAGVLIEAWPVAVTHLRGQFHRLSAVEGWGTFREGRYRDAAVAAMDAALTWGVHDDEAAAVERARISGKAVGDGRS